MPERRFGDLLATPPCGLHVHVGVPDPGHESARASLVRGWPRFQLPRHFRDYEDLCRVAEQLIAAAGVDDYTYIWWDVRPHPRLGTVEVRPCARELGTDAALDEIERILLDGNGAADQRRVRGEAGMAGLLGCLIRLTA